MTTEAKLKAARDAAELAMSHANAAEMEAGKAQGHAAASVIAADAAGLAAAEAVELMDEVLTGEGGPDPEPGPGPGEPETPDLTRGLLYQLSAPTSTPIDLPKGSLLGVQTIAMVAKAPVTTGKFKKFCGCASSQSAGQGAFGIGLKPNGMMDVWRAGGGQQNPMTPNPPFPAGRAIDLIWQQAAVEQDLTLGEDVYSQALLTPLAVADGECVIGAGYWAGKKVDPIDPTDEIRYWKGWNRVLTAAEVALVIAEMAPLTELPIDLPSGAGLEPVNPALHQVFIKVDAKPRQEWHGFGFGLNNWSEAEKVFPHVQQNVRKLCEDLDTNIMRIFTPESPGGCIQAYRPYWNLFREHGVDTIFASCFLYRSTAANATDEILSAQARKIAHGIKDCNAGGLNAEDWFVSLQNEPEGNPANGVKGNYVAHHTAFLDEIERLDLAGKVHLVGLEWRHGPNRMPAEYDAYGTALLGQGKIEWGCHHIYDKSSDDAMFDARWAKQRGIWSTELGNNSDSASSAGRMIAGMNHGSVAEIVHYCQVTTPNPSGEQLGQALLDFQGRPRPWYGALQTISTTFARGDTFRLCTSTDRPAGLPTKHAERMIRNAATGGGRNPRQEVAVAFRNGKALLAAVNTTHGADASSPYTSGHYGAQGQQLTVTIPELSGKNGRFFAKRAKHGGGMENGQPISFKDGFLRFSLAPGETVGLTQE